MIQRDELIAYLDEFFDVANIGDSSINGLQIKCPDRIEKVAFAVDFSLAAIKLAEKNGAQLLIVHHGQYFGQEQLITGLFYERVKRMIDVDIGLYAVHLPLDVHPRIGNAITVCNMLGLENPGPFGLYSGISIGLSGSLPKPTLRDDFAKVLAKLFGKEIQRFEFGDKRIETVGVVTGGGSTLADQAIDAELDAFVTGEIKHSAFHIAKEGRLNMYGCGHYATEYTGIKELLKLINGKFNVETVLLDIPTGL